MTKPGGLVFTVCIAAIGTGAAQARPAHHDAAMQAFVRATGEFREVVKDRNTGDRLDVWDYTFFNRPVLTDEGVCEVQAIRVNRPGRDGLGRKVVDYFFIGSKGTGAPCHGPVAPHRTFTAPDSADAADAVRRVGEVTAAAKADGPMAVSGRWQCPRESTPCDKPFDARRELARLRPEDIRTVDRIVWPGAESVFEITLYQPENNTYYDVIRIPIRQKAGEPTKADVLAIWNVIY